MKKFLALTLSAFLAIGALAGCSSSESTEGGETTADGNVIKIGVFEPQTGENGGGGLQEVYGMRYATRYILRLL